MKPDPLSNSVRLEVSPPVAEDVASFGKVHGTAPSALLGNQVTAVNILERRRQTP